MQSCGNRAWAEALESRLLLSVFVRNHVLHVEGTRGDDRIVFRRHDSEHLKVEVNGKLQQFEKAQVRRIEISAGAGNDYVFVARNNVFETITGPDPNCEFNCPQFATTISIVDVPGSIKGGDDDDTIVGGSGDWTLKGGDGADRIRGGDQYCTCMINMRRAIFGGRGDDTLIGGMSRDRIIGGDGDDVLIGRKGDDLLEGGDGFDTLDGGGGNDILNPGPQPRPLLPMLS